MMPVRSSAVAASFPLLPLFALLALALVGCDRDPTPQLVSLVEVTPREVEVGDRIEIAGAGFPQGRTAFVTFEGALRRPGELPLEGSVVQTEAMVTGPQTIELAYTDALQSLFCGAGDRARHTAFDGQVTVGFAAVAAGAPPIAATLRDVSLDLRPPPPRAEVAEARAREGERALAYAGIHVEPRPLAAGGLVVASIEPGSRAERAGVLAADRIARFDGVRVVTLADAAPSGARASVTLGVLRGGSAREESLELPLDGFRTAAPRRLVAAACILGLVAVALLLLFGPSSGSVAWVEHRLGSLPRGARLAAVARAVAPEGSRAQRRWALAGAAIAVAATPLVVRDVDVAAPWLVEVSALVTLALVTGRGIVRAAWVASFAVARGASLVAVVVASGSLRLVDVARAQGGAPWGWNVFRTPIGWALFLAFVLPALARPADARSHRGAASPARSLRDAALAAGEWAALIVTAALGSALFFGGWELPGMSPGEQDAHATYRVLGCLVFAAKSAGLLGAIGALRAVIPELRDRALLGAAWRAIVPASLAASAASVAWTAWGPGARSEALTGGVALASALLVLAVVAHRIRAVARAPELHVDPFL